MESRWFGAAAGIAFGIGAVPLLHLSVVDLENKTATDSAYAAHVDDPGTLSIQCRILSTGTSLYGGGELPMPASLARTVVRVDGDNPKWPHHLGTSGS